MSNQKTISSTSQNFLDIHDITNDTIILKNGSTSIVLTVNAMNFGLLAEQEQDAVIYSYAGLLNSINYPIQILIQSQTKDASSYLELLEKREEKTKDEIKRAWIRRYSQFVSDLIKEHNVLDKKFFVVIPASSLEMGLTPTQNIISGFKEQSIEGIEKSVILEKAQNLLEPKKDHLIAQFHRIGLYARQLSTQEIIRLFYTNYNPEATEGQQITNSQSYTTALVQAQIRGDYMNDQAKSSLEPTQVAPAAQPTAPADNAATPVDPKVPAAIPSMPVEPAESEQPKEEKEDLVKDVNVAESPILQKPMSVGTTPMPAPSQPPVSASAPSTPTMPATPSAPIMPNISTAMPGTVEITKPELKPNPIVKASSESTMSTPIQPMTPLDSTVIKPTSGIPPKAPVVDPIVDATAQKNINDTLNQLTEKPTQ